MAQGLLDFINTPAGQGLLSGIASYAMNARRDTPVNNIGRGLAGGLVGYQGAQEQLRQESDNALTRQYKKLLMEEITKKIENQKAQQAWRVGLPQVIDRAKTKVTPFEADNPFGEDLGNLANVQQGDPQAMQDYMMQPDSPYAGKMIERQLLQETEKPQLVTVYGEDGKPMQKWLRPGKSDGVTVGMGKPDAEKNPYGQDMREYLAINGIDPSEATPQQLQSAYSAVQSQKDRRAPRQSVVVNPALDPFKNEQSLRKEYQDHPLVKSAAEMTSAFRMIESAYKRPSAANDLAMATKYMKILDPTSVVRESEFALAVNATGLMDKVYNYSNMIKTGQRLNPAQRKDFYDSSKAINDAFQGEAGKIKNTYRGIAGQYGLSPDNTTLGAAFKEPTEKPEPKPAATFDLPPNAKQYNGKILRDTKSGKRFMSVNGKWVDAK